MEEEGVKKIKHFLSDAMNTLVTDTELSTTFLFLNRSPADNGVRKCCKCPGTLKPHDPVTKIRKCGHIYHTDCYAKHMTVIHCSNSSRWAGHAVLARLRSTKAAQASKTSKTSWKSSKWPSVKRQPCTRAGRRAPSQKAPGRRQIRWLCRLHQKVFKLLQLFQLREDRNRLPNLINMQSGRTEHVKERVPKRTSSFCSDRSVSVHLGSLIDTPKSPTQNQNFSKSKT